MKVRVKVRPTGLINGREWPEVGQSIDLPEVVAADMAAAGFVESERVEVRPAPTQRVEKRRGRK